MAKMYEDGNCKKGGKKARLSELIMNPSLFLGSDLCGSNA